jgi:hypothetical protein
MSQARSITSSSAATGCSRGWVSDADVGVLRQEVSMLRILKMMALLSATVFSAIAIYINLVEQPSRLLLEDRALLAHWAGSFPPGMKVQGTLAILSGLSAIGAFYFSRNWLWLLGGVLMLANWPYTLLAIYPVNGALLSMAAGAPAETARVLIEQWGWLHAVRSALGAIATLLFVLALSREAGSAQLAEVRPKTL